jgi:hypothetical protein
MWCLIGLLFSCSREEEQPFANPTQIDEYFSIIAFLEEEIPKLEKAEVAKVVGINGRNERMVSDFTEEGWWEELDVFYQADINKAALSAAYTTEDDGDRIIHRLKEGEKAPVRELTVDKRDGKVSRVYFLSKKENLFYTSETSGTIQKDPNTNRIATYHIHGKQKVWFIPYNEMEVVAEVTR